MKNIFIIGVTGVPATGKTTFSKIMKKELARAGKKVALVELNSIVEKKHIYSSKDKFGTKIVDTGKLSVAVNAETKKRKAAGDDVIIIVGHLAPDIDIKYNMAVVTRLNLKDLLVRMGKRAYPSEKVRDNIVSETYDYCGMRMQKRCRETYEVETDTERKALLAYIKGVALGNHPKKPKTEKHIRMNELLELINKNKHLGF